MVKKVGEVDKDIYHYLSYNAKDEDRKLLCRLYEILFYSYHINNITPQLMQGRDSFYHELSRNIERNEEQFAFLSANLSSYIRDVQATIKQYDYAALSGIYPEEHLIKANEFAKEEIVLDDGISGELINTVFQIVGEMYIAHKELEERVTYTLAKIADVFIFGSKKRTYVLFYLWSVDNRILYKSDDLITGIYLTALFHGSHIFIFALI